MVEIAHLKNKLDALKDIKDIVGSMKAFANFTIQKSKKELLYVREYQNLVEDSIAYMITLFPELKELKRVSGKSLYILFGSEEGLCGAFNEKIFAFIEQENIEDDYLIVVGRKANDEALERKLNILWATDGASKIESIQNRVADLTYYLGNLYEREDIENLFLVYAKIIDNATFTVKKEKILPPDFKKFEKYVKVKEPLLYLDKSEILDDLIEEYLLISLYRAFIESISSENQARLQNMQNAQQHIKKLSADLHDELNILRQEEITNELMEIINGFKAIKSKKEKNIN
jgi:alternate F1F0 ATPase F1 subunit gamma